MEYNSNDLGIQIGDNYLPYAINKTYSFVNNSLFYAYVNPSYYQYYYNIVRENMKWYDGYVDGFHNVQNGIFSTRIGSSLCNAISDNIFAKGVRFKNVNKLSKNYNAINFLSTHWLEESGFNSSLKLAIEYSCAGGTSLLKLNQSYNQLWCEAVRTDNFYFRVDASGQLQEVNSLIKVYASTSGKEKSSFILTEHRFYKYVKSSTPVVMLDGKVKYFAKTQLKPFVEYSVNYFKGQITSNLNTIDKQEHIKWLDIPLAIRKCIQKDYTAIRINEPLLLPFKDLGCELINILGKDTHCPLANFGKSLLTDCRSYLVEFDLIQSYAIRDKFNGQGQLGIPKSLSIGDFNAQTNPYNVSRLNYELYPGDPNTQKPIINQFELRNQEWQLAVDNCLKKISMSCNVPVKVIASYIVDYKQSSRKTATEVQSDDDNTYMTSDRLRKRILPILNRLLKNVLRFYQFDISIMLEFIPNKTIIKAQQLDEVIKEYNAGFIDLRIALAKLNEDFNEEELDILEEKVKAYNNLRLKQHILVNNATSLNNDEMLENDNE